MNELMKKNIHVLIHRLNLSTNKFSIHSRTLNTKQLYDQIKRKISNIIRRVVRIRDRRSKQTPKTLLRKLMIKLTTQNLQTKHLPKKKSEDDWKKVWKNFHQRELRRIYRLIHKTIYWLGFERKCLNITQMNFWMNCLLSAQHVFLKSSM